MLTHKNARHSDIFFSISLKDSASNTLNNCIPQTDSNAQFKGHSTTRCIKNLIPLWIFTVMSFS